MPSVGWYFDNVAVKLFQWSAPVTYDGHYKRAESSGKFHASCVSMKHVP